MAKTYSQSPEALAQLVAHFKAHGVKPPNAPDSFDIPFDDSKENRMGPWSMEVWHGNDAGEPTEEYRWYQGGMEVEAFEVYEALFQI